MWRLILALALPAAFGWRAEAAAPPLRLETDIPLAGVQGRIDHLAVDLRHGKLFVAALGNGSVEAIDLNKRAPVGRIAGLQEPQGLAYYPDLDQLAVATGGDGMVRFYRGADLGLVGQIKLGSDADNLRIDPASGMLVVGYGSGALALIDPQRRTVVKQVPLPGHPEGFQFLGRQLLVNIPDARTIVVGSLDPPAVSQRWKASYLWNYPMAVDPASKAVAIVYRMPARLVVLDADTGRKRFDLSSCGDADDVFFDAKRTRLYVTCGSGSIQVVDAHAGREIGRVKSGAGGRTSLYVPALDRLFVAIRNGSGRPAHLMVFAPT